MQNNKVTMQFDIFVNSYMADNYNGDTLRDGVWKTYHELH